MSNFFSTTLNLLSKKKYIFLFIGLFLIVLTQRVWNDRQHGLTDSIASDGLGYYSYLPAAIIYHDFKYKFYDDPKTYIKSVHHTYFNEYKDTRINKYYCGTAICFLPFFLLGVLISAIAGTDINGYTDTFLMLISLCSIFYFLLSVHFISKIAEFFKTSKKASLIICLVYFFGTNLFHYVVQEPSMSHVYSFFAISLFFYLYTKLLNHITNKNVILLALSLTLIALIRPPNVIIILFLPFFSHNLSHFFVFFKELVVKTWLGILVSILIIVLAVFLQFFFYYLQTGEFFIMTYEGETFNFSNPEFLNMFFSYKKGLFLYTPLFLGALIFMVCTKANLYKKIIFFITLFVFSYITASWWCWWYGGGFSIRPFVDILPLYILITMILFNVLSHTSKKVVIACAVPFLLFNQLKSYQYANLLITTLDMNKEMYWDFFIESDLARVNENKIKRIIDTKPILKSDSLNFENNTDPNAITHEGYKSQTSGSVGSRSNFSKGLDFAIKDLNTKDSIYIIAECQIKTIDNAKDLILVISETNNGNILRYEKCSRNQFNAGENGWVKMTKILAVNSAPNSIFSVMAYCNTGESYIDDIKYTVVKK